MILLFFPFRRTRVKSKSDCDHWDNSSDRKQALWKAKEMMYKIAAGCDVYVQMSWVVGSLGSSADSNSSDLRKLLFFCQLDTPPHFQFDRCAKRGKSYASLTADWWMLVDLVYSWWMSKRKMSSWLRSRMGEGAGRSRQSLTNWKALTLVLKILSANYE